MNIFIAGDHSSDHCGSKAVIQYLRHLVGERGFTLVDNDSDADCILINGEGTMHDNQDLAWPKLRLGKKAKDLGKQVHLVNSVWQNMGGYTCPAAYFIKEFDSVFVRELISYNEIKSIRPDAKIATDLSYFLPVVKPVMSRREIIVGGFYITDVARDGEWIKKTRNYKRVNIQNYSSWQDYLNGLAPAKLLISGFHHEIIAAIKLRIPFVAYRGNTDKVLGIIRRADANIPVASTPSELLLNLGNLPPQKEYDKLFDFLENEKPFDLTFLQTRQTKTYEQN